MNRYALIQKELMAMNQGKFQVICNVYLQNEYKLDISSPGTVEGKEKTRPGKPDIYLCSDKHYILAECTTKESADKSDFYKKLSDDLDGCLDFEVLGISKEQVNHIILCCNSDIDSKQDNQLKKRAKNAGAILRVVGLTTLTLYFMGNGKAYARQHLDIPFDTGQILTKEDFIKHYGKKNIATPLDNNLYGRDNELKQLSEHISANNIVVMYGQAGVGKSRLAIEAIDEFIKANPSYTPYYIFNKNTAILEDLMMYIEFGQEYILLIDDGNRQIENLLSVINKQLESDMVNIKIVITVRDYSQDEVLKACRHLKTKIFGLSKLSNDDIKTIITSYEPMVDDKVVIDRIVEISAGNPRLSMMARQAYVVNKNINILHDASTIYNEYFQSIIDDKEILSNANMVKTLGILAYFNSFDLDEEADRSIPERFDIPLAEFVNALHYLADIELVDVYLKNTFKISDQILGTYFFYRVFVFEQLLDFDVLLNNYFEKLEWRMRDSLDGAVSSFGETKVIGKINQKIQKKWQQVPAEKVFDFMAAFGKYIPDQLFLFLKKHITDLNQVDSNKQFEDPSLHYNVYANDPVIRLLESFYKKDSINQLQSALALGIMYVEKCPGFYETLTLSLKELIKINTEDIRNNFIRQKSVITFFQSTVSKTDKNRLLFYYVFNFILLNNHYPSELYVNNNKTWTVVEEFQKIRSNFWQQLEHEWKINNDFVFRILMTYLESVKFSNTVLLNIDLERIKDIIKNNLNGKSFRDCFFVHQYVKQLVEKGVNKSVTKLTKRFDSFAYKVYESINFDYNCLNDRDRFDDEKVNQVKCDILQEKLPVENFHDYRRIEKALVEISDFEYHRQNRYHPITNEWLGLIFKHKKSLGFKCLESYLECGNPCQIYPVIVLREIFKARKIWAEKFYSLVQSKTFQHKDKWVERFFWLMPEGRITNKTIDQLLSHFRTTKEWPDIYLDFYDNFRKIDANIRLKIVQTIVKRRKEEPEFKYRISSNFFEQNISLVLSHTTLFKELYFQKEEMQRNDDQSGKQLFILLQANSSILYEYIDFVNAKQKLLSFSDFHNLSIVWQLSNAEQIIETALMKIIALPQIRIMDHISNIFFAGIDNIYKERAISLLRNLVDRYSENEEIMNLVMDISRNCFPETYLSMLQYFLNRNTDFLIFKRLNLYNNHFSSNGNELWSDFIAATLRRIYNAIMEIDTNHLSYLEHKDYLGQHIAWQENQSSWERKMQFRGWR